MEGPLIRLFNSRKDSWFDHFGPDNGMIVPLTDVGEATVKLLELNDPDKILERRELEEAGVWP